MCFFTEAQQRAFDALQQRRAQAVAQAAQVSGFNPFAAAPTGCAPPTTSTDESAAAKVVHAIAQTNPQLVTRFIQEVVQQQLQQATSSPFTLGQKFAVALPTSDVKRPLEDAEMSSEPFLKRQKMDDSDDSGNKKDKRRFVWTPDMRELFDRAVSTMEPELIGPKNIYNLMLRYAPAAVRDSQLNTQHIKSHLQKWRMARRRAGELSPSEEKQQTEFASSPSGLPQLQSSSFSTPVSSLFAAPPTPTTNVSPEPLLGMQQMSSIDGGIPEQSFHSPLPPVPKMNDLESSLLLEDLDGISDPLLSSWDALFAESPVDESLNTSSCDDMPSLLPTDVLTQFTKSNNDADGLSNADILKYMMLGYQLGYQNCFSEAGQSDSVLGSSDMSLSLF